MGMLIATTERVAGYEVQETLGEVFGIAVRSRGLVGNMLAGLKTIVGGEISQYTEMLQTARQHAIERMVAEAQRQGADAVLMMRLRFRRDRPGHHRDRRLWHGGEAQAHGITCAARKSGRRPEY